MARWLDGAQKVATLLAATLAAVAALGLAASAASAETVSNTDGITFNDGAANCAGTPPAPGKADPYPSEIAVSGLGSSVSDVNVTVSGLGHSYPADIGLLLVSPAGQSVILMSDSGGNVPVSGINLTFDDAASGDVPRDGPLTSGTFLPSRGPYTSGCPAPVSFPEPAPASPYGSSLSVFNGTNPNGSWKLYVIDDTLGDTGSIGGWSLEITTVTSDTTDPTLTVTHTADGSNGWNKTSPVTLNISASDSGSDLAGDPTCTDGTTDLTLTAGTAGNWTASVSGEGTHTISCSVSDNATNTTTASDTVKIDTKAPTVTSTFPRGGGEVGPAANIRATFSEDMQEASVKSAFKLFKKGSTTQVAAAVTYDAATHTATLNPTNNLKRGATYKAVVSTVAKDMAGNRLDQDSAKAGLQQKKWFFEIDN